MFPGKILGDPVLQEGDLGGAETLTFGWHLVIGIGGEDDLHELAFLSSPFVDHRPVLAALHE